MSTKSLTVLKPEAPARRDDTADRQAGEQLTAQYRRAVEGMREVITFGAMMLGVRDQLAKRLEESGGNASDKGTGLKAWLAEFAPEVPLQTARRFMDLADTVRQLVKLTNVADMVSILTASASTLQASAAKKRAKIEKLIEGRSQRQLLLMIGDGANQPPAKRGGDNEFQLWLRQHHPELAGTKLPKCPEDVQMQWVEFLHGKKLGPAELAEAERASARAEWTKIADFVRRNGTGQGRTWAKLNRSEIEALAELFGTLADLMNNAALKRT